MAQSQSGTSATRRKVLIADPHSERRTALASRAGRPLAMEAASLCEAFPLAEQSRPDVLALSADLLTDPDFQGLLNLAAMLGSQIILYASERHHHNRAGHHTPLPCIMLDPGDDIGLLLAKADKISTHRSDDKAGARAPDIILLGASTGGIAAIETVLLAFPVDCPPTLVVQHIRHGFIPGLVRRLNDICRPQVVAAIDGEPLQTGFVYFAADANKHLTVSGKSGPRCTLIDTSPRNGHRPAVDQLFESALPWASGITAALLTGMGNDGALGLNALRAAGAHTIAQDRDSCIVWGMPRAAVELGAAAEVLALNRIGPALLLRRGGQSIQSKRVLNR